MIKVDEDEEITFEEFLDLVSGIKASNSGGNLIYEVDKVADRKFGNLMNRWCGDCNVDDGAPFPAPHGLDGSPPPLGGDHEPVVGVRHRRFPH